MKVKKRTLTSSAYVAGISGFWLFAVFVEDWNPIVAAAVAYLVILLTPRRA